ncbi:hypothetical protein M427DRAFT_55110 [Gonapodya prolifera JEL478]|uniref:DUF1783-domain-containing protein n=1 Tax=Gonapodya prolifera (strain JEL478) TaxID=1344416 RepID=A0A139AJ77_GONPJ|nr:hypothetical protein M427DRAFT_55110 [Gonapodya prolifera JEL478]|eukprot:KXS16768.1 hypothetical protein M427DRAFT_55110 [Gonapodya prolifera JEL478]
MSLPRSLPGFLSRLGKSNPKTYRNVGLALGTVWGGSLYWYYMFEKRTTPIFKLVMFRLRSDPRAEKMLGNNIELGRFGHVSGTVTETKGIIDCTFWVQGSHGSAAVEVKGRRDSEIEWHIEKFIVKNESGRKVSLA